MKFLETISNSLTRFFNALAQARAASAAARMHRYDEAARIIKDSR